MSFRFDSNRPAQMPRHPRQGNKSAKPRFRAALADDGALELLVYGDIVDAATISMLEGWGYPTDGLVSSLNVKKALDDGGAYSKVRLRINSPGGDAFEGMAIHSLLVGCGKPVEAYIDGIAASSASIIAMAAETRIMGRTAMMIINNAWASCVGNKNDMTKMASTLDTIDGSIAEAYCDRTGLSPSKVKSLMDEESCFSAQDCVDNGLATAIAASPTDGDEIEAMAQARRFRMLGRLHNVPAHLRASDKCECECDACKDGDCEGCTNADCDDQNCVDCPMQAAQNSVDSMRIRLQSRTRIAASAVRDHANEDEVDLLAGRLSHRTGLADHANEDEIALLSQQNKGRIKVHIPPWRDPYQTEVDL